MFSISIIRKLFLHYCFNPVRLLYIGNDENLLSIVFGQKWYDWVEKPLMTTQS